MFEPMVGFSIQGHCRNVEVQYEAFQFILNSENRILTFDIFPLNSTLLSLYYKNTNLLHWKRPLRDCLHSCLHHCPVEEQRQDSCFIGCFSPHHAYIRRLVYSMYKKNFDIRKMEDGNKVHTQIDSSISLALLCHLSLAVYRARTLF